VSLFGFEASDFAKLFIAFGVGGFVVQARRPLSWLLCLDGD
jgi:hypothetical protein